MLWLGNWLTSITPAFTTEGIISQPVTGPDFPFWEYSLKILTILTALIGLLILLLALWKRVAPRYHRHPALIRVLATHYLAPKQALILVAVGKETFLLASSASNLSVIPVKEAEAEMGPASLPPPQA